MGKNIKNSNNIVISVINLETRQELAAYKDIYEKGIADICLHHINKNEKIFWCHYVNKKVMI